MDGRHAWALKDQLGLPSVSQLSGDSLARRIKVVIPPQSSPCSPTSPKEPLESSSHSSPFSNPESWAGSVPVLMSLGTLLKRALVPCL